MWSCSPRKHFAFCHLQGCGEIDVSVHAVKNGSGGYNGCYSSVAKLYPTHLTPWTIACQVLLSSAVSQSLLKFVSIELMTLSNHLIFCHSLLFASISQHQGLFQWVSSSHQVAKILELQLQQQSFQWIFRDDFLRIDWFDLFAVQGTVKSLPQHHNSKASILCHSDFFMVQLSYQYMTTGKTMDKMDTCIYMAESLWCSREIMTLLIGCIPTASLVAQRVKHLPAMQETQVQSLEKEMATYSGILAWEIPCIEKPGRLWSIGSQRVRHDWATSLSLYANTNLKV